MCGVWVCELGLTQIERFRGKYVELLLCPLAAFSALGQCL